MKNWKEALFCLLLSYVTIALVVFQFRHPWATETQRFLNIPKALVFGTMEKE